LVDAKSLVIMSGQGQDRTVDLPLFRQEDTLTCPSMSGG
jgi:hypothetical protein